MPGGGCRGGIPGLGPCMTPGPGMVITGAPGDPRWLSLPRSEGVPLSPLESLGDSSGCFTLPAAKEEKIRFYRSPSGKLSIVAAQKKNRPESKCLKK